MVYVIIMINALDNFYFSFLFGGRSCVVLDDGGVGLPPTCNYVIVLLIRESTKPVVYVHQLCFIYISLYIGF